MHSPEDAAVARHEAELHALLRVLGSAPTRNQPGQCLVDAELLTVWRAPAPLAPGARIELWVDSRWRGQRSPPGADQRLDLEDLTPGRMLEVHACAMPPEQRVPTRFEVRLGLARLRPGVAR